MLCGLGFLERDKSNAFHCCCLSLEGAPDPLQAYLAINAGPSHWGRALTSVQGHKGKWFLLITYHSLTVNLLKNVKGTKGQRTHQQPQTVNSEIKMEAFTHEKMLSRTGKKGNADER